MNQKQCNRCNMIADLSSSFCGNCGQQFVDNMAQNNNYNTNPSQPYQPNQQTPEQMAGGVSNVYPQPQQNPDGYQPQGPNTYMQNNPNEYNPNQQYVPNDPNYAHYQQNPQPYMNQPYNYNPQNRKTSSGGKFILFGGIGLLIILIIAAVFLMKNSKNVYIEVLGMECKEVTIFESGTYSYADEDELREQLDQEQSDQDVIDETVKIIKGIKVQDCSWQQEDNEKEYEFILVDKSNILQGLYAALMWDYNDTDIKKICKDNDIDKEVLSEFIEADDIYASPKNYVGIEPLIEALEDADIEVNKSPKIDPCS